MRKAETTKSWRERALELTQRSLGSIPLELNEVDWKSGLSPDKIQLKKHLSAFSNYPGGGFLLFGVGKNAEVRGLYEREEAVPIVTLLGNIARDGLEPSILIDYSIEPFRQKHILIIRVPESADKPVHLRGKGYESSYIRSAGESRKMSKQELAQALMSSRGQSYEMGEGFLCSGPGQVFERLDVDALYQLQEKILPSSQDKILSDLSSMKLIKIEDTRIVITNLGVLICAKNFTDFEGHQRRGVRIVVYKDSSRLTGIRETIEHKGYAIGFQGLLKYTMDALAGSEVIRDALRKEVRVFPEIAVREILANALIHQDLTVVGLSPMVEIFPDRMEITNPGRLLPTMAVDRLIDTTQESRNELLARFMRQLRICEERGSGIDKAIAAIELFNLPPIEFTETTNAFKVTLFAPKKYKDMTQEERIRACYQHCVLKYVANQKMTNTSLRERLGIPEQNYPMVSRIIKDTIEAWKIKKSPSSTGKKDASYVPFWA